MTTSLFVAGLDYSVTNEELENLFNGYGTVVSAKIIMDKLSGKSKGFGFVEMSDSDEASRCIKELNNSTFRNRQIAVREKTDNPERSRSSGNGFRSGGYR